MLKKSGKGIIRNLFRDVLESSEVELSVIEKYIDPGYIQKVDGVILDYHGFIEHMKKQKQVIEAMSVTFISMVEESDTVFTNHIVVAKKKNKEELHVHVIAQFTLKDGRLIACDELTRLLTGNEEDRNIGSCH
ncbi:nuclear transport factor 2 family protein [Sulfurospirillum barnesii]|uniref:SnoaL-like domain-containing protein n=1 Tax=Sulfurospirillum barnesii (strain ATCC 700032 / DSM 10660 / SES-3) TaxID=760154 RepID=I3XXZ7_SULBS|nr:nuclear transport factor 2 family protein [Sulfurospirillum barnesii]AFL68821.1 hypothetical protein Sulba_1533 [Sulfurospirillum barnesii SES-3]